MAINLTRNSSKHELDVYICTCCVVMANLALQWNNIVHRNPLVPNGYIQQYHPPRSWIMI